MDYSKEEIINKIAAAFRFVGENSDFRKRAGDNTLTILFEIEDMDVRNLVTIDDGSIFWGSDIPENSDLRVRWKHWEHLTSWTASWMPLWWYRLLRRVHVEGEQSPVLQECLYLFRNYLHLMMKEDRNGRM